MKLFHEIHYAKPNKLNNQLNTVLTAPQRYDF